MPCFCKIVSINRNSDRFFAQKMQGEVLISVGGSRRT